MKKEILVGIAIFLGIVIFFVGLSFAMGWVGVGYTETVGLAQQNAETKVYKKSQAYIEGQIQSLNKYRDEYERDTSILDKKALRNTILQESALVDKHDLPEDLAAFINQIRGY